MRGLSLSWIDATDLSVSLSRAGITPLAPAVGPRPPSEPTDAPPETGEAFRAETATHSDSSEATPSSYDPPDAPLGVRLSSYLQWVAERTGCSQIFVADTDGLVVIESSADPDLVTIAAMFVNVLDRIDDTVGAPIRGSVSVDLDTGESLHVIRAETGLGPHALGFAVHRAADRETIDSAQEGLVRALGSTREAHGKRVKGLTGNEALGGGEDMKHREGRVHGVSPATFLQMVEQDKTTCTVNIASEGQSGRLHFQDGVLMDAETGDLNGTDAAYAIMNWRNPELEVAYDGDPRPRRIERPLMAILLDVHKMVDDASRPSLPSSGVTRTAETEFARDRGSGSEGSRTNTLPACLDDFQDEVPEFVSTDVVNVDSGLSISGISADPDFDASVASACSAEVVKANRRTLELLGLGAHSTEDILISSAKVYLLIRMLGPEYYHVLAVNRKGNLGLARAIMKKHQPRLLRVIRELE